MNIRGFNERITKALIDKRSAAEILYDFNSLKNQEKERPRAIIDTENKDKFIILLKELKRDVTSVDFSREDLSNLDLSDMTFINCAFEETLFNNSIMDGIEFVLCTLDYASFYNGVMECACFRRSSCRGTDFSKTHLMATYIEESDWSGAIVIGANLLEIEAHKWKIDGMKINENTAVGEGEFYDVDWSKTNVSNLNISINQVEQFLQCTNGGKYLQVYEDYTSSSMQKREDAILKALWNDYDSNKVTLENIYNEEFSDLIFLSYASEQEKIVREFYQLKKNDFHLWMDMELIKEDKLKEQIEKVLRYCKIAVIILSKEYLIKAWTRYELLRLSEEKKKRNLKIIIVNLEENLNCEALQNFEEKKFVFVNDFNELIIQLEMEN